MEKRLLFVILCVVSYSALAEKTSLATATFAGGCFWCMEHDFDKVKGVSETVSGYIGGHKVNPTYKEVTTGKTGHTEAVRILYNPDQVSYGQLLHIYWRSIDPTTDEGQFCDLGSQYRPEIFYHNEEQRELAERSKQELEADKPFPHAVKVRITQADTFYPAEEYHQNFHEKNPFRYKFYRRGCGRDKRLEALWGKKAG